MENRRVGLYFKKINERLEQLGNGGGQKSEVTFSQGRVLCYLHSRDGEKVTIRDIEKFFECSHATVSGILSRLAEKGLVLLEADEADRRAKIVLLTDRERASFLKMQKFHEHLEAEMLKDFSEEERELLIEYLKRVYGNLCSSCGKNSQRAKEKI